MIRIDGLISRHSRIIISTPVTLGVALSLLIFVSCSFSQTDDYVHIEEEPGPNPWNHLRFKNDEKNFQFAIISDLTGRLRPGVFQDAVRKLNLLQPEFVMTAGDLIEGHTNDASELNHEWDLFFKAVEPLEMPIFYVPGNHDYWYRTTQGAAGNEEVYDMASVYNQRMGRSYYHFVYRDVLFLILNNTMGDASEIEAEKRYIAETLKKYEDVRWTITFFHYAEAWVGRLDTEIWDYMAPLLKDRPFTSFGANSHQYIKFDKNGRDLINLATTGGMSRMRGPRYGEFDHIVWVTMTDDGPVIANLMLDGIYDKNVRTLKSKEMMSSLLASSPVQSDVIFENGRTFNGGTLSLRLVNPADLPLHVDGIFQPNEHLRSDPSIFKTEVPGNSEESLDIKLYVDDQVDIREVQPLVLTWTARYFLSDPDPDVKVSGKHRIIVDTLADRPVPTEPIIVERFSNLLNPAWNILGTGGSFNGHGQFTLAHDRAQDANIKDSEGRYTDGPTYELALQDGAEDRTVYKYTDGRGLYTTTPLFHLPVAGMYRDIPPDTFEAELKITNIHWGGDNSIFRWEFWDVPDLIYNYGPSYLNGVILQVSRESGKYYIALQTLERSNIDVRRRIGGFYTDATLRELGKVELDKPPSSLVLRANWRESSRSWEFFYGIDGSDPKTAVPGGEFVEDIEPSSEGKRNVIYVRNTRQDDGFSIDLDEYRLLH